MKNKNNNDKDSRGDMFPTMDSAQQALKLFTEFAMREQEIIMARRNFQTQLAELDKQEALLRAEFKKHAHQFEMLISPCRS